VIKLEMALGLGISRGELVDELHSVAEGATTRIQPLFPRHEILSGGKGAYQSKAALCAGRRRRRHGLEF